MELTNEFTVGVPVSQAWAVLTDVERIAPCMPGAQLQEVEGDEYRGIVKVKVGPITAQYKGVASFQERDEAAGRAVLKASGRDTRGQGTASALVTATLEPAGEGTRVQVHTDLTVTGKVAQFGRGVMADVSAKLLGEFVQRLEADVLAGAGPAAAPGDAPSAVGAGTPDAPAGGAGSGSGPTAAGAVTTEVPVVTAGPVGPEEAVAAVAVNGAEPAAPVAAADATDEALGTAGDVPPAASSGPRRIDSPEPEPVDLMGTAGLPVLKRVLPLVLVVLVVLLVLARRRSKG